MRLQCVIEVGSSQVTVLGQLVTRDGAHPDDGLSARAVVPADIWVGPDGDVRSGSAAVQFALISPEQQIMGWVDRIGDPVPFHTEAGPLTGSELMVLAIAEPMAEVVQALALLEPAADDAAGQSAEFEEILAVVVIADGWSAIRVRRVEQTVSDALRTQFGVVTVRAIRRGRLIEGLIHETAHPGPEEGSSGGGWLVLDVGASTVRADVVDADQGLVRSSVEVGLGGALLDDRVFRHVLAQVPEALRADPATPEATRELMLVRAAGRQAREELSTVTESIVPVRLARASSDLRLVRPEIESLLDDDFGAILDVGQRAIDAWGGRLSSAILIGGCARTPRLVQLASARWSVPIDRPGVPENALAATAVAQLDAERQVEPQRGLEPGLLVDHEVESHEQPPGLLTLDPAAVADPSWGHGVDGGGDVGGEHLVGARPRARRPVLVGAILALVLAGGAAFAMSGLTPGGRSDAALAAVDPVGEDQTLTLAQLGLGVPWAPGILALPAPSQDAKGGAPARELPGVPTETRTAVAQDGRVIALQSGVSDGVTDASGWRPRASTKGSTGAATGSPGKTTTTPSGTTKPSASTDPTKKPTTTPTTPGPTTSTPTPTTPGPTTPAPTTPAPTTPAPTTPAPTTPAPTTPAPTTPAPTTPAPTTPAPTDPGPTDPGPTEPEPTEPPVTEPGPTGSEPTDPGSTTPDPSAPTGDPGPTSTEGSGATP